MVKAADTANDIIPVLLATRERLALRGWMPGRGPVDKRGHERKRKRGDGFTLVDALWACPVTAARWHARILLSRVAGDPDLVGWGAHPMRTADEVFALIDKSIIYILTGQKQVPAHVAARRVAELALAAGGGR